MNELLEIEKIKQLKARYFRSLDTNDWELFADCLTENCSASYSDGMLKFDSRAAIVDFMSTNMSAETFLSMHTGHHPEITLGSDGTSASGIWYLQDMILDLENNVRMYGAAIYTDEYDKSSGEWKISQTGYKRTFECVEPLGEKHNVSQNMFAKKA